MLDGEIRRQLLRFKYQGKTGWAPIFGRLVVGWLNRWAGEDEYDLVTPMPTYLGPGSTSEIPHTEEIIKAAAAEDQRQTWPFDDEDPTLLIRTGVTPRSAGQNYAAKRAAAAALRDVLEVTADVRGLNVLVFDDVCTTGSQLDVAAAVLLEAGARSVEGLVLARTPWGGP